MDIVAIFDAYRGTEGSFSRFWHHSGQGIILTIVALVILLFGYVILNKLIEKSGVGPFTFQMFGLAIFMPVLLFLAAYNSLDETVLATLMGAIAGYLFGAQNKSETQKSNTK